MDRKDFLKRLAVLGAGIVANRVMGDILGKPLLKESLAYDQADWLADDTALLQRAIDECAMNGGGIVILPNQCLI